MNCSESCKVCLQTCPCTIPLQDRCLIGCPSAYDNNVDGDTVDIVLQGIGVHSKHALLTVIAEDNEMFIEPLNGARLTITITCCSR
jgi:hypothetical protein